MYLAATAPGIAHLSQFASRLTNDVTAIAGAVAVLFVAINGIRFAASNGHPRRQMEAKSGLVAAGAGLAVVLCANLIVQLVISALQ